MLINTMQKCTFSNRKIMLINTQHGHSAMEKLLINTPQTCTFGNRKTMLINTS